MKVGEAYQWVASVRTSSLRVSPAPALDRVVSPPPTGRGSSRPTLVAPGSPHGIGLEDGVGLGVTHLAGIACRHSAHFARGDSVELPPDADRSRPGPCRRRDQSAAASGDLHHRRHPRLSYPRQGGPCALRDRAMPLTLAPRARLIDWVMATHWPLQRGRRWSSPPPIRTVCLVTACGLPSGSSATTPRVLAVSGAVHSVRHPDVRLVPTGADHHGRTRAGPLHRA